MERNTQIRRAVRQTLVMSAVATAATLPAHAQEADEVDTIVVTGSRIRSANLEGSSPVTQVTAADIATQAEFASLDASNPNSLSDAAKRFDTILHYAERALGALDRVRTR